MNDLTYLQIQQLIVHEMPKQKGDVGVVSDELSPLPQGIRNFFKLRLQTALGSAGVPITFVSGHVSPVPTTVKALLANPTKRVFIESSQAIAKYLFDNTKGTHSPGLLCCISGTLSTENVIAIVKLELQDGVRAHLKNDKGKKHFEIEIVDDLLLTRHTRVFKVALFQGGINDVEALACDSQVPRGKMIASYFLDRFLGCQFAQQPDVLTKKYFEAAGTYLNTNIADAETRSRYYAGLLADLNTTRTTVQVKRFAEENMDSIDRGPFLAAMTEATVPRSFSKDVTRIKAKLRRIRWDFDGDLSVSAPKEALEQKTLQVESLGNGNTRLELEARLKKVTNAGR
jgi:hypothetical protein